jgi:polyvinyl alcohol dehydrogenase (cytochrome)
MRSPQPLIRWIAPLVVSLVAMNGASGAAGKFTALRAKMDASKHSVDREKMPGAAVYHRVCEQCHDGLAPKAPARTFLEMMTPEAIDRALTVGIMRSEAAGLSVRAKREVAEYLSGLPVGTHPLPPAPRCDAAHARIETNRAPRLVGWGMESGNERFIPGALAGLDAAQIPRLKLKWAFAFPAAVRARSQPSFAYGTLYIGSPNGAVYALDPDSGCIRWTYHTSAEVRTPIVVPPMQGPQKLAFFGDILGHVHAVDAATGRELWERRVDDHPSATITGAPVYHDGTLYVPVSSLEEAIARPSYPYCTFRGSVVALDAANGRLLWKRYTIDAPPHQIGVTKSGTKMFGPAGAAVWNTPTIDARRGLLYVGTGNNYTGSSVGRSDAVLALSLATGRIVWSHQIVRGDAWNVGCMVGLDSCPPHSGPDSDIGAGTMLATLADGRQALFVGLKNGTVVALDPAHRGKLLWSHRIGRGSIQGGIQFGMAFDGRRLFVPISDMAHSMDASEKVRLANAGPPHPGLYALDPNDGRFIWSMPADDVCGGRSFCDPGILAAVTAIPGAVFAGHMDGRLRAYGASTGRVLWQYDTTQPVKTLNGTMAHGGSIGDGGPVVYHGMVYTNSGYGLYFHMPGNVLLAFSIDGR